MKKSLLAIVLGSLAVVAIVLGSVDRTTEPSLPVGQNVACRVPAGQGHMGSCVPEPKQVFTQPLFGAVPGSSFYGADVSNWQGCVNPRGLNFVIIKLAEGRSYHDPSAHCTAQNARRLHIPYGFYFFERDQYSATQSAERFAALEKAEGGAPLPGSLDFETNDGGLSNQSQCNWVRTFNARYRALSGNRVNVTYDAPGLWPGCASVPASRGWVASLGNNCSARLSGMTNVICQYSFHGPFGGDADLFLRGNSPAGLSQAAHGPPPPPPAPPVGPVARRLCSEATELRRRRHRHSLNPREAHRLRVVKHKLKRHRYVCNSHGVKRA